MDGHCISVYVTYSFIGGILKVVPASECFYFSAPNWEIQGLTFRSEKIQCKQVCLNYLKLWFLCLGAHIPKKGCSESPSVPFRRTLDLTLRFQNKNASMSRDKAARVFPVCHFFLHIHHFQLCLSGLHLWVHPRRHTASLIPFLQTSTARKPDPLCFLILQWKCCWGLSLLSKLLSLRTDLESFMHADD